MSGSDAPGPAAAHAFEQSGASGFGTSRPLILWLLRSARTLQPHCLVWLAGDFKSHLVSKNWPSCLKSGECAFGLLQHDSLHGECPSRIGLASCLATVQEGYFTPNAQHERCHVAPSKQLKLLRIISSSGTTKACGLEFADKGPCSLVREELFPVASAKLF